MVGLDCSIIMNPKVWVASGHVGGFSDPMVDCKACKGRFRADQICVLRIDSTDAVYDRSAKPMRNSTMRSSHKDRTPTSCSKKNAKKAASEGASKVLDRLPMDDA